MRNLKYVRQNNCQITGSKVKIVPDLSAIKSLYFSLSFRFGIVKG